MYLLAVTMYEFRQFLQLLMWVALPLVLVVTAITITVHYWRKKRDREAEPDLLPDADTAVMPHIAAPPVEGQQGYKGVLWLRNKYEQDIEIAAQKHDQLKEEYNKLEKRYQDVLDNNTIAESSQKNESSETSEKMKGYEETIRQLKSAAWEKDLQFENLQNELKDLRETNSSLHNAGEKELQLENLQNELRELHETYESLKKSRETLLVPGENHTELSVLQQELLMSHQEKASLKAKLIEQESLQDLLEEKTRQIHFLENQLEQRIKTFHEVEFQGREDANRVKDFSDRLSVISREKQEQAENIQAQFNRIMHLENELQTLGTENITMQNDLNEKIHYQARVVKEMADRLEFSNRLLRKLQREINASLESQYVLNPEGIMPAPEQSKPKISAWIESPSEEFEHII